MASNSIFILLKQRKNILKITSTLVSSAIKFLARMKLGLAFYRPKILLITILYIVKTKLLIF